ncbi:hypothetical protein [Butyrivibrio sp. AC2005]|uniref:hypothetical protein n=1 Tax=Butyrivibrio sp. AC2005 TaxID=1280672 RepID=UPI0003F4DBEB|nr:hypothetical protein [Butyrivibrio sp. AC2005]
MNIEAVRKLKRLAVAVAISGTVLLWVPMPGATAHAANCTHENYEWVTLVKPTCSKIGKDVKVCQDCEEILETEYIEKKEHKGKWERTKEPTCAATGLKSYVCKNCNAVIETEVIPKKNHKFVRTSTIGATCQSPKVIEKECSTCGLTITEQSGDKLEHKYGNWSIKSIKVKGKNVNVIQIRTCTRCNESSQLVTGTSAAFSGKHGKNNYFYKLTKRSGRITVLCAQCHQSVTGKISGGVIKFTRPKRDNSKHTAKAWKSLNKMHK